MLTCAPLVQVTDAALDYLTYYTRFPEANTDGAPCSRPLCPAPRAQLPSTISRTCLCLAPWGGGRGRGRRGGTTSQERHSWSAATTTQSAASSAR